MCFKTTGKLFLGSKSHKRFILNPNNGAEIGVSDLRRYRQSVSRRGADRLKLKMLTTEATHTEGESLEEADTFEETEEELGRENAREEDEHDPEQLLEIIRYDYSVVVYADPFAASSFNPLDEEETGSDSKEDGFVNMDGSIDQKKVIPPSSAPSGDDEVLKFTVSKYKLVHIRNVFPLSLSLTNVQLFFPCLLSWWDSFARVLPCNFSYHCTP